MCSCNRDGKPHSDACRKAHEKYNHSTKGIVRHINAKVKNFEKETGVKV